MNSFQTNSKRKFSFGNYQVSQLDGSKQGTMSQTSSTQQRTQSVYQISSDTQDQNQLKPKRYSKQTPNLQEHIEKQKVILGKLSKEKLIESVIQLKIHNRNMIQYYSQKVQNNSERMHQQKLQIRQLKKQTVESNTDEGSNVRCKCSQFFQSQKESFSYALEKLIEDNNSINQTKDLFTKKSNLVMQSLNGLKEKSLSKDQKQQVIFASNFKIEKEKSLKRQQNSPPKQNNIHYDIQKLKLEKKYLQSQQKFQKQIQEERIQKKTNQDDENQMEKDYYQASAIALIYCIFSKVQYEKDMNNLQLPRYLIDFVAQTISNKFIKEKSKKIVKRNKSYISSSSLLHQLIQSF